MLGCSPPVHAATNAALGGIGGLDNGTLSGGDGTGTARVTLNVVDLALVKQARDLTGRVLPNDSDVAAGQEIWFVLFVDNATSSPADSIRITDALTESQFKYVPNSLETVTVTSGSSDAAMWAANWTPVTDATGSSDAASIVDTGGPPGPDRVTIGDVPIQANRLTRVPGNTRVAVRFRARVQ